MTNLAGKAIFPAIKVAKRTFKAFGGYFDLDSKEKQLKLLQEQMHEAAENQDLECYQTLRQKHRKLQGQCAPFFELKRELEDWEVLWEMGGPQVSQSLEELPELKSTLESIEEKLEHLTWLQRFKPEDDRPCYVDIVSGSGGVEAQDWSQMLLRMYLKWADLKKLQSEMISLSEAETAGIKSATLKLSGAYAFGWMKTESGVHRLVRCSPFDANHRRHTSFAAVYVTPVVEDEDKSPELNLSECRVDVFRASGAGGQHVNKTESAVRITHLPTGLVVQSQADRSQHRNKEQCIQQLKAKLHQRRLREKEAQQKSENAAKPAVSWGSQIRSYVLDDARVKDLRTGVESRNPARILDGDLDRFVLAALDQLSRDSLST